MQNIAHSLGVHIIELFVAPENAEYKKVFGTLSVNEPKSQYKDESELVKAYKDTIEILKKDVEELRIDNLFLRDLIERTYNQ